MTSRKRDTKSKSHSGMKLAPVRVFSCKHPLRNGRGGEGERNRVNCVTREGWVSTPAHNHN